MQGGDLESAWVTNPLPIPRGHPQSTLEAVNQPRSPLLSPQPEPLAQKDIDRLTRKCKSLSTAYAKCMHVNKTDPGACTNLETALVACWGGDLFKELSEEHQRCYMSLINTGAAAACWNASRCSIICVGPRAAVCGDA